MFIVPSYFCIVQVGVPILQDENDIFLEGVGGFGWWGRTFHRVNQEKERYIETSTEVSGERGVWWWGGLVQMKG